LSFFFFCDDVEASTAGVCGRGSHVHCHYKLLAALFLQHGKVKNFVSSFLPVVSLKDFGWCHVLTASKLCKALLLATLLFLSMVLLICLLLHSLVPKSRDVNR
jgi:hypothetical protein